MATLTIKNTRPGGFGIPGGPVIEPGQSMDVDSKDWGTVKDHPVVKHWVDQKWLEIDGDADSDPDPDVLDREDLKKQAKELGIDHAQNISTEKLKELIDAKLAS